jgi:uncharacterized Zn finger protein (UPF0148 family)
MGKVKSFSAKLAHETSTEGKVMCPICKAEIKRVKLITNKRERTAGLLAMNMPRFANATRQTSWLEQTCKQIESMFPGKAMARFCRLKCFLSTYPHWTSVG